mgnify:CR=1 FL=1|jgi:hypothetical protein
MLKRSEPQNARCHTPQHPNPKLLDGQKVVETIRVSDALARVYALILSWPAADEQTSTETGGNPE